MRVVVVGATGNVGTSLVRQLAQDSRVEHVVGIARRVPALRIERVEWRAADVRSGDLPACFRGADCVVHLAWKIQPAHRPRLLHQVNVEGSARVFRAVVEAGVPALVYASSVGAYGPGPKDRGVDESWPANGVPSSMYSRQKAAVEHLLDRFEREHPHVRVVRLRPGLIFKPSAARAIRRYFLGPFAPTRLVHARATPIVPALPGLRFQAVHTDDVARAYRLAVTGDAAGAFNIAADPVLDAFRLARLLDARIVPMPARVLRAAMWAGFRAHVQPTEPGWLDLALQVPVMSTDRARGELGWVPEQDACEALGGLLDGLRAGAHEPTPVLR
jgi:UDP-glucose 4-epimerase